MFASAYYMKEDAQYADVVVPITTRWENAQAHLYLGTNMKDKELSVASRAPLPRIGECRTDREIAAGIAERLGFDYEAMNPNSDTQCWFDQLSQTVVMRPEGPVPVASVTQEDLDRYGVNGPVQKALCLSSSTSTRVSTVKSAQRTIRGPLHIRLGIALPTREQPAADNCFGQVRDLLPGEVGLV